MKDFKIIPVVVVNDELDTRTKLNGLREGGIMVAEITFRTAYAEKGIRLALEEYKDMCIGAGTVINKYQALKTINMGVEFIVSPGFSKEIAELCAKNNVKYFPGCVTPTEIMEAIECGIEVVKFFPANIYGGLKAIDALSKPFPNIKFLPTGGVNYDNIDEFLTHPNIYAVGGSFMMKGDIAENCKKLSKWLE